MNKLLSLALALLMVSFMGTAQSSSMYETGMKRALEALDTAATFQEYMAAANQFERITQAEKTAWLPAYYTGLTYAVSFVKARTTEEIDQVLDRAEVAAKEADKRSPNNSEVHSLFGQIDGARISVSPMTRGAKYGPSSMAHLQKAIALDSTNPRPQALMGISLLNTPPMFGGGPEKALPVLEKAHALFEAFEPETPLHPNWGASLTLANLNNCRKMVEGSKKDKEDK